MDVIACSDFVTHIGEGGLCLDAMAKIFDAK